MDSIPSLKSQASGDSETVWQSENPDPFKKFEGDFGGSNRGTLYMKKGQKMTISKASRTKKLPSNFIRTLTPEIIADLKHIYSLCDKDRKSKITLDDVTNCKKLYKSL